MSAEPEPDRTVGDRTVADVFTPVPSPPPDGPTNGPFPVVGGVFADGRYRVTGQLGVGGMGLVMRAEDATLGRDVAVKVLADNLSADAGARARFLREARAAAAVSDPRVVAVFDVGDQDGRPYLVMELIDGPSLADVLARSGPLPGEDAVGVATDALAGLHAAHRAGLLHRDVKPGNLLRASDGTTKVTDFGVAMAVDGDKLTRTGFVIGTAPYLAPERRRGEPATVRTDLWALGAALTELLTGEPPGHAADALLAGRGDAVPADLRHLVSRLLAHDPEDRPADALAGLELLAGDPSTSFATTPPGGHPVTRLMAADVARQAGTSTSPPHDGSSRSDPPTPPPKVSTPPGSARGRRGAGLAALIVALAALGLAGVWALAGSGQEGTAPDDGFGPVVVDPADPAGTIRELGEQLREHAGR